MKKYIAFFVATIVVAVAIFAILYWLFKVNYSDSFNAAITAAFTGLLCAILEPYFARRAKEQEQRISERVKRGLHRTHRNDKLD
jgi:membrane protein implicated in regulation of membrane protease activity